MKDINVTGAYNALYQQHSREGFKPLTRLNNLNNQIEVSPVAVVDTGISCHVFAIRSPYTWDEANQVNNNYENIMPLEAVLDPLSNPWSRDQSLDAIKNIANMNQIALTVPDLYLCGGNHAVDDMVPEHMWLEDHTHNRTYDTFINRGGIAVRDEVGVNAQDFRPGCEGSAFSHDRITRRKVDGYTWGHLLALAGGVENPGGFEPIPDGIANSAPMVEARAIVTKINDAYANYGTPPLTPEETDALDAYKLAVQNLPPRIAVSNSRTDIAAAQNEMSKDIQGVYDNLDPVVKGNLDKAQKTIEAWYDDFRTQATAYAEKRINAFIELNKLVNTANERIEATLAAIDPSAQNYMKKVLEQKRDDILAAPKTAHAAMEAFNDSMSPANITLVAQGIKDGLQARGNPVLENDEPGRALLVEQMKTLMTSYVNNDGKLAERSLVLTTNERIGATLESVPEARRDAMKIVLEKQRDDILKTPNPEVALDAFNKSMSDGNIIVLAQGIKDGLTAVKDSTFGDGDQTQELLVEQMKELMTSYAKNDGKLTGLSLGLTTEKNQLAAADTYAALLALTRRMHATENVTENMKTYVQNLVDIMKDLPLEQRLNFPNSKEPATFNVVDALLTTNKDEPAPKVDGSTLNVENMVLEKLTTINEFLDEMAPKEEVVQNI